MSIYVKTILKQYYVTKDGEHTPIDQMAEQNQEQITLLQSTHIMLGLLPLLAWVHRCFFLTGWVHRCC